MPWEGRLEHIFIAERASVEMEELTRADLLAGIGIDGDRYATGRGKYSPEPHEDRQVTLIEAETLDALRRDHRVDLTADETRRNLTVRGVPLNHLVGRHFFVGNVLLYGGRLNTPCKYLDALLGKELFALLLNRSGLNCRIIRGGIITPGAPIRPVG
jgi:MOSC domain-containing protein YiiM